MIISPPPLPSLPRECFASEDEFNRYEARRYRRSDEIRNQQQHHLAMMLTMAILVFAGCLVLIALAFGWRGFAVLNAIIGAWWLVYTLVRRVVP
jgi:Flp pilus assembly protein TadB